MNFYQQWLLCKLHKLCRFSNMRANFILAKHIICNDKFSNSKPHFSALDKKESKQYLKPLSDSYNNKIW